MTSSPATTRLLLVWEQITPSNSLLSFTNETGVANYYGASSIEATMAGEYFTVPNAMLLFTRIGLGQRSHLLGANISNLSLTQLQAINGSVSITFNGYVYNGNVNLAGVASFADAATEIQSALHDLPVTATTTGDSIQTETLHFTGYLNGSQLMETSGPALVVGGKVTGAGLRISSPDNNQIIYSHTKPINGATHYSLFASCGNEPTPEAMTETYSIFHPGAVTSGAIEAGQLLTGADIPNLSAIISGDDTAGWIINNPITANGNFTTKATPLEVKYNSITGKTENHDWFSIQPNGAFGFDNAPNTLSFLSGTAASALGLSQASGALDSTPGGQHPTIAQFMNQVVKEASAAGEPFTTLQDVQQDRFDTSLKLWTSNHPGYTFLPEHFSAPPPGSNIADGLALLHSGSMVESSPDNGSLVPQTFALAPSVGHGPGASS